MTWKCAQAAVVVGLCTLAGTAGAVPVLRQTSFGERWIEKREALVFRFDTLPGPGEGALAFVVANADVTVLLRQTAPGEYTLDPSAFEFPTGSAEAVVYSVREGRWAEIARVPLRVLNAGGFETFTTAPRAALGVKGQLDEGHSGTAQASPRGNYQDLTFQGGLSAEGVRQGLRVQAGMNLAGSSYRPETLRYGQLRAEADKLDLSDYLASAQYGDTSLAVGHFAFASSLQGAPGGFMPSANPLLANGLSSRGLTLRQRLGERADVSVSVVNGTAIVGFDNFFGVEEVNHQIRTVSAGYELFARRGALRLEVGFIDSSLENAVPFNRGTVPGAQDNRGLGLTILGSDPSGRLRAAAAFARMRTAARDDPVLAQGAQLTPIRTETRDAFQADMTFDLLRPAPDAGRFPFTLSLIAHYSRAEPLYFGLGSPFGADFDLRRAGANLQAGPISGQLTVARRTDNLDDIPTLLKTGANQDSAQLNLPLGAALGLAPDKWWAPTLGYRRETTHQRALNAPPTNASGFSATHLPDQRNIADGATLSWNGPAWQLGYAANRSTQDNRQAGRENADFENSGHALQGGWRPAPTLNLNGSLARNRNFARETALTTITKTATIGFEWGLFTLWTLSGNYSAMRGEDSSRARELRGHTLQTQLARRFDLWDPFRGRNMSGQMFVRHVLNDTASIDNVVITNFAGRGWSLQFGLTLNLF